MGWGKWDFGDKVIGDTVTKIDFPYKCKRCGQYIKVENRHWWKHRCFFYKPKGEVFLESYDPKKYINPYRTLSNKYTLKSLTKYLVFLIIVIVIILFVVLRSMK